MYYGKSFCYLKTTDRYKFLLSYKESEVWAKPIIHIGLCDYFTIDDTLLKYEHLIHQNGLGDYHLIRINLPFYNAVTNTDLEQWLLLITASYTFDTVPLAITSPIIQQAFNNIKLSNFDKLDLEWYLEYENRLEERRRDLITNTNMKLEKAYLTQIATQPGFSVALLKKDFGLYPKQKVKTTDIDLFFIENALKCCKIEF